MARSVPPKNAWASLFSRAGAAPARAGHPAPPAAARPTAVATASAPLPASPAAAWLAGGSTVVPRSDSTVPAVSDELATALARLAAEYAPLPLTTAPFVSARQKEADAREQRHRRRRQLLQLGAGAILALGAFHLLGTTLLFRFPADEALAAEVAKTAQLVLSLHSNAEQPLEIGRALPVLRDRADLRHLHYSAEVTLQLRQPLYVPAQTNGTVSYRLLQQSLSQALEKKRKLGLFPLNDGPPPPELPGLLQLAHRAGDRMVVRVPFEAAKFGWQWRIAPAQLAHRTVDRRFEGLPLARLNAGPYLIFGLPETMADIRARMAAAREYLLAVAREVQRRDAASSPAMRPPIDPDKLAVEPEASAPLGTWPPFDPDKPAVAPANPPQPGPSPAPRH